MAKKKAEEKKKLLFYVHAPGFNDRSGGVYAMHLLCHHLNEAGHEAWVTTSLTSPSLNAPYAEDIDPDGIAVYPEGGDNSLGLGKTVRWILADSGLTYTDDLIFSWSHLYDDHPELYMPIVRFDYFWDAGYPRRGVIGWATDRKTLNEYDQHAKLITGAWPEDRYIYREFLQTAKYMVCGEDTTLVTAEARICGCPILSTIPKSDYKDDLVDYGVAFSVDELESARESLPEYRELVQEHEDNWIWTFKSFLNKCEETFS